MKSGITGSGPINNLGQLNKKKLFSAIEIKLNI